MTFSLPALAIAAIALPHLLRLESVRPVVAVTIWLAALMLRALAGLLLILYLVLYFPSTELFGVVTSWCWHAVLPLLATHLPLDGHQVGDAATLAPAFVITLSVASVLWAVTHTARAVRMLQAGALGGGPQGSLIVAGRDVLVAAAGLTRPRVVVSTGALATFDDAELAASLDHERGHIARRHRYLLILGQVCGALAPLPGNGAALAGLSFHLERDADAYALARRHDQLALASAICKVAVRQAAPAGLMGLGGGPGVVDRLRLLTGERRESRRRDWAAGLFGAGMVLLVLAIGAMLPAVAVAGLEQVSHPPVALHCPE